MNHNKLICLVSIFSLLVSSGCKEDGNDTCELGARDCPCDESDKCAPGLVCDESSICVDDRRSIGDAGPDTSDPDNPENTDPENETEYSFIYEVPLRERIVDSIYTADPSAHVFEGKLYVYPSHDQDNANVAGTYNMVDYHVISLSRENAFVDHGKILALEDVPWARDYAWAPDAAYRDGAYYFYFPARDHQGIFRIGVATSDSPEGPFTPEDDPIEGSYSMDPAVFIDDDGQAYMYFGGLWGGQLECWESGSYKQSDCEEFSFFGAGTGDAFGPMVARLRDDMKQFEGETREISIVDSSGTPLQKGDEQRRFFEGAWMHKYNDTYYLSYSTGTTCLLVYATGDNPLGPFTYRGVLLPNHNRGWTTHHSVVAFLDNWYLFYHDNSCSGDDHQRCVKVADMHYESDGSIKTVSLH